MFRRLVWSVSSPKFTFCYFQIGAFSTTMSQRIAIHSEKAPAALGPYSQAIKVGPHIYVSGQLGLDAITMNLVGDTAPVQAHKALDNITHILTSAGACMADVVSVTVLLVDMEDFTEVNNVYERYFPVAKTQESCPPPARMCYAVKSLPKKSQLLLIRPSQSDVSCVCNECCLPH